MNNYNSILVLFLTITIYIFSEFLIQKKYIKLITQRRFWNIVLLISFLTSGILGLFLAVSLDNKMFLSWYRSVLWLHVEAGIVMAVVSIFHALWHVKYYLSIFKK